VPKLKNDARAGGARKKLEKKLGRSIVSNNNYINKNEDKRLS